jgi:hypothetical protein
MGDRLDALTRQIAELTLNLFLQVIASVEAEEARRAAGFDGTRPAAFAQSRFLDLFYLRASVGNVGLFGRGYARCFRGSVSEMISLTPCWLNPLKP